MSSREHLKTQCGDCVLGAAEDYLNSHTDVDVYEAFLAARAFHNREERKNPTADGVVKAVNVEQAANRLKVVVKEAIGLEEDDQMTLFEDAASQIGVSVCFDELAADTIFPLAHKLGEGDFQQGARRVVCAMCRFSSVLTDHEKKV